MALKTCSECNIEKDTSFFSKNGTGFRSKCKECTNKVNKTHKKVHNVPTTGTFRCCKCELEKSCDNFNVNVRGSRGLGYHCKECESILKKERRGRHPESSREESRKRRSNVKNRIRMNLGTRVYLAVEKKHGNTMELTGCSKDDLYTHLESKFTDDMTWENYGKWHIDHIKPCASFDLTDPEEQKKCFHWTNLQPLWAIDNMRKGAKYVSVLELGLTGRT